MALLEWKTVHEIVGANDILVRIQRAGDRKPRYSLQLGRKRRQEEGQEPNDRPLPFVPVFIQAQGSVSVDRTAEDLVKRALDWIHEDAVVYESSYVSTLIERDESRDARNNNGAPTPRRTGKTERTRNKQRGSNGHGHGHGQDD